MKSNKPHVDASPQDRIASLHHESLSDLEKRLVVQLALKILRARHRRRRLLSSPVETRQYLQLVFESYRNEVFGAIFLDNRHRVLGFEELFFGTIDGASVHPRVVVQRALDLNSAAVIFAHNHPSGVVRPCAGPHRRRLRGHRVLRRTRPVVTISIYLAGEASPAGGASDRFLEPTERRTPHEPAQST